MDLAQKATRAKRELQSATQKPDATSIRHAVDAFDAFVDGVVEEIGLLKAALKDASAAPATESSDGDQSAGERSEKELENAVTG